MVNNRWSLSGTGIQTMRQSSCVQASIAWSSILVLVLIGAPCSSRLRVTAALVQRRAGVPPVSCWRASPRRGASARGRWLALTWSKRYCQAAQPAADRSAQRLIPCRRWAAPAASWVAWARSCPPWARQRAPTDAAPCLTHPPPRGPPGRHRLRCAPPVPLVPVTPNPLQGAMLGSAARAVGRRARVAGSCVAFHELRAAPCRSLKPPAHPAPSPCSPSAAPRLPGAARGTGAPVRPQGLPGG